MDVMCAAVRETQESKRLKPLLEIVLALGNHLNGNTARGGAYGFKLDSLTKVRNSLLACPLHCGVL